MQLQKFHPPFQNKKEMNYKSFLHPSKKKEKENTKVCFDGFGLLFETEGSMTALRQTEKPKI